MTNTTELVLEIKRIIEEEHLEPADLKRMMEEAGEIPLSDATISRLKEKDSETNRRFNYDFTLAPLARVLGIDAINAGDSEEVKALKEMLRLKHVRIKELEQQLDKEIIRRHEQLDELRQQNQKAIDFLKNELAIKNKRMDEQNDRTNSLLDRIDKKDDRIEKLTSEILAMKALKEAYKSCPYKHGGDMNGNDSM